MKTLLSVRSAATAAVCLLSIAMSAQVNGSASAGASTNGGTMNKQVQTNGSAGTSSETGSASAGASGGGAASAQVPAELVTKLDSKSAKAGDAVVAKTTKTVKTADGIVIKKGSKLMGTVSQSQAYSKGQAEGMLALSFNRVQMAGGEEMQLTSSIESISPPMAAVSDDLAGDEMIAAGPVSSGGSVGSRNGLGVGGAVGGATGAVGGATSSVGSSAGTVGRTSSGLASSAQRTGSQAAGVTRGAAGELNGTVSGTAQQSSGLAAHATNLPGVMLSGSTAGSTSSVLSASSRNVHLDSGTQMVLSVAAQR